MKITIADRTSYLLNEYVTAIVSLAGIRREINLWVMPYTLPFTILLGRDFMHKGGIIEDHGTQLVHIRDAEGRLREVKRQLEHCEIRAMELRGESPIFDSDDDDSAKDDLSTGSYDSDDYSDDEQFALRAADDCLDEILTGQCNMVSSEPKCSRC